MEGKFAFCLGHHACNVGFPAKMLIDVKGVFIKYGVGWVAKFGGFRNFLDHPGGWV